MQVEPYKSARTVFWIVDNGSRHAGNTSIKRISDAYPNARLIHLPVHASWLNQAEIFFSIIQRKGLTPDDFATLPELARHLMDFAQHYRNVARPFQWTFTRTDLYSRAAFVAAVLSKLPDVEVVQTYPRILRRRS